MDEKLGKELADNIRKAIDKAMLKDVIVKVAKELAGKSEAEIVDYLERWIERLKREW